MPLKNYAVLKGCPVLPQMNTRSRPEICSASLRQRDSQGADLQSYLVADADINSGYRRIGPVPQTKATRDEPALAAGQPASSMIAAVARFSSAELKRRMLAQRR